MLARWGQEAGLVKYKIYENRNVNSINIYSVFYVLNVKQEALLAEIGLQISRNGQGTNTQSPSGIYLLIFKRNTLLIHIY